MVRTGIRSRLTNRHATEGQDRASCRSFHAPRSAGQQLHRRFGIRSTVEVDCVDVNLTSGGRTERKTNWQRRSTNHTSVKLRKYAQRIGPAAGGGRVYEKSRHVDV
jgi:hypothetical protein